MSITGPMVLVMEVVGVARVVVIASNKVLDEVEDGGAFVLKCVGEGSSVSMLVDVVVIMDNWDWDQFCAGVSH